MLEAKQQWQSVGKCVADKRGSLQSENPSSQTQTPSSPLDRPPQKAHNQNFGKGSYEAVMARRQRERHGDTLSSQWTNRACQSEALLRKEQSCPNVQHEARRRFGPMDTPKTAKRKSSEVSQAQSSPGSGDKGKRMRSPQLASSAIDHLPKFNPAPDSHPWAAPILQLHTRHDSFDHYQIMVRGTNRAVSARFQGGLAEFFLDYSQAVTSLQEWVNLQKVSNIPLLINGLTKAGKTFLLTTVLRAMLSMDDKYGTAGSSPCLWLQLDLLKVCCGGKYFDNLRCLHHAICCWAAGKTVAEASLQTLSEAEAAIVELLASFNHHVFLAMDEIQAFFHIGDEDLPRARLFMKSLLNDSPSHVLVGVTGSSLALFWLEIAKLPTNGMSIDIHPLKIDLPSTAPDTVTAAAWDIIATANRLPLDLQHLAGPYGPACIVTLARAFLRQMKPLSLSELWEFVQDFELEKLRKEAIADLLPAAQRMSLRQRLCLRALSEQGVTKQDLGKNLKNHLLPYLEKHWQAGQQLYYITTVYHRSAIQNVIESDGTVILEPDFLPWPPVATEAAVVAVLRFGETVKEYLKQRGPDTEFCSVMKDLHNHPHLNTILAGSSEWANDIVGHEANDDGLAQEYLEAQNRFAPPAELVGLLHMGMRNIIAHEQYSGTSGVLLLHYPFCRMEEIAKFLYAMGTELKQYLPDKLA